MGQGRTTTPAAGQASGMAQAGQCPKGFFLTWGPVAAPSSWQNPNSEAKSSEVQGWRPWTWFTAASCSPFSLPHSFLHLQKEVVPCLEVLRGFLPGYDSSRANLRLGGRSKNTNQAPKTREGLWVQWPLGKHCHFPAALSLRKAWGSWPSTCQMEAYGHSLCS